MTTNIDDISAWVQKWVNDIVKWDNIGMSLEKCGPLLKKCNLTRKFIGDIVVELGRNVFHESGAFLLYQWETILNHSRASIILALSGLYNLAFTLLRNSLELLIKGAFYEGLVHEKYRPYPKYFSFFS
ncbi:MAG: hypothetical protein QXG36_05505 [Nitrososphaeria archaeon]